MLTDGTTHYRTEDRGKSWRPFDVPLEPAMVSQPLSFHLNPKKYGHILYQGASCEKQGWGKVCHDEASDLSCILRSAIETRSTRHFIPRKPFQTNFVYYEKMYRDVNLLIAAQISSTKLTTTSFTALATTRHPRHVCMIYHPVAFSPAKITFNRRRWRISE